jgi:type I restriction enzyme M protein
VLRDDGITYHEYLNELTYLLFLKLAKELGVERAIPSEAGWENLNVVPEMEKLTAYRKALKLLGDADNETVRDIFTGAKTAISSPTSLHQLVQAIDDIDWYRARQNGIGDVYEGLIEKNAQESRYGAGQYFTPRAVVEAIVQACQPTPNDSVYDPAAGTGGFLIAAGLYARTESGETAHLSGIELVSDVRKLGLMNLILHDLQGEVTLGDALHQKPHKKGFSLCLTNPPFGVKGSLTREQSDLLDFPTGNKQLAFLQHAYKNLAKGGRAAIVVPDNVLFEEGVAASIRAKLLQDFRLHTVLRLPTGIFYASGVRTSVLFFCADGSTSETWFYDLREGQASFGKRRQFTSEDLQDFVKCYGHDAMARSERKENDRFRSMGVSDLAANNYRLDVVTSHSDAAQTSTVTVERMLESTRSMTDELGAVQSNIQEIEKLLTSFVEAAARPNRTQTS